MKELLMLAVEAIEIIAGKAIEGCHDYKKMLISIEEKEESGEMLTEKEFAEKNKNAFNIPNKFSNKNGTVFQKKKNMEFTGEEWEKKAAKFSAAPSYMIIMGGSACDEFGNDLGYNWKSYLKYMNTSHYERGPIKSIIMSYKYNDYVESFNEAE